MILQICSGISFQPVKTRIYKCFPYKSSHFIIVIGLFGLSNMIRVTKTKSDDRESPDMFNPQYGFRPNWTTQLWNENAKYIFNFFLQSLLLNYL